MPPAHRDQVTAPSALVVAAFATTMSSAFGQTYFIGLFAPNLKAELELSDGSFGSLYTIANLASGLALLWVGKLADGYRVRWLSAIVLGCLAVNCIALAHTDRAWMLLPILFGLRLFGQGLPGHLAMTGVGRWYVRRRGRMMSFAVLGFPAAEAVMPIAAVGLIGSIGWRATWLAAAGVLLGISIPMVLFFLRHEPPPGQAAESGDDLVNRRRQWSRAEALRSPVFWVILVGTAAPPFVLTGIIFHQAYLVAEKGWTLSWFASWFPLLAATSVVSALATGRFIDRYGARRLLPFFLLPMAIAVTALAVVESAWVVPVFMALVALTNGTLQTLLGALWVELFGTQHLGAIRSVAFAAMVFASAVAPGLLGLLLDQGVALERLYLAMAAYSFASALALAGIALPLKRMAR